MLGGCLYDSNTTCNASFPCVAGNRSRIQGKITLIYEGVPRGASSFFVLLCGGGGESVQNYLIVWGFLGVPREKGIEGVLMRSIARV